MPSYIRKMICFFIFFYVLLIPSTIINALAEDNIKPDTLYGHLKKTDDTSELVTSHIIGSSVKTVSHILSSSPSELAKQATSYALGKFNGSLSSEAQKWLSQFGTARINFGLNREFTLENNSLDILMPLYDNKTDWLFFSQLGYRNRDSRNTINLGLGGRYFYQNWMYGLNTFYDHDLTGKNQRLGLGGEIWGDYIKLSANTYYRLSDWHNSQNFQDYYERPANSYDINGEFFLPAYPSLGMKLTYEKYFGDNVALFNRDTKQKNPSLATFGLNYTPVPLFTIEVDYKQGESGHTETQFLANLNYKFGVPISTQLLPANMASMRTLAGSRYDLVERNNHIILDHQKIKKEELIALKPIIGYGYQDITVNAPVLLHSDIKHIYWTVTDQAFKSNGGKLPSDSGKSNIITLPSYQETHENAYMLDILLIDSQEKEKLIQVPMKVLPFMIDGKVKIIPPESPESTGNKENGYTFDSPVITYKGSPSGKTVNNARIDKVTWTTEPALDGDSGLEFIWNNQSAKTNEKGQLTDEKGQLIPNILSSQKPYDNVDVYIQLDGAPRQKIGSVMFSKNKNKSHEYQVKNIVVDNKGPLIANSKNTYIYTAYIVDGNGKAVPEGQKITNIHWGKNSDTAGLKFTFKNGVDSTGSDGTLTATLGSTAVVDNVVVSLSVEEQKTPVSAKPVAFIADKSSYHIDGGLTVSPEGPLTVGDGKSYTFKATIVDGENKRVISQPIDGVIWKAKDNKEQDITLTTQTTKTNEAGELIATLDSKVPLNGVKVSLAIENHAAVTADPVSIKSENIDVTCKANDEIPVLVDESYMCTAKVTDAVGKGIPGKTVNWMVKDNSDLKPTPLSGKTNENGEMMATLTSRIAVSDIVVTASVEGQPDQGESKEQINFIWPEITIDTSPKDHEFTVDGQEKYSLTATVWREENKIAYKGQDIKFKWTKPQLSDGTDAPDVTLSPSPDTLQFVNSNDGTLKIDLASNKAQQVKACLNIDGRTPASPTCSALINFIGVPPEFKIASVEVTNFDKDKPLQGDGISEYEYRALIVTKDKEEAIPGYMFKDVKWMHNHDQIEPAKFPQPEAYSPTNEDKFKTDEKGYLYAKLKSHVGVEGVMVTLKILDGTGAENNTGKKVAFKPIVQSAVLYAYGSGKNAKKSFDNNNGKRHPHNIFAALRGALRPASNSSEDFNGDVTYEISDVDSPYGDQMLYLGLNNRGPIEFRELGSATITAIQEEKSGEIRSFEYKMSAVKKVNIANGNYKTTTGIIACSATEGKEISNTVYLDKEMSNPADTYALTNEFNDLYGWGLFNNIIPPVDISKLTAIVKNTDPNNENIFRIYDFNTNDFDDNVNSQGLVICHRSIAKK
ncbi:inverse autotransporter beta domain-containing protein [Xenorhabdus sp. Vera]|uniref:inverse autotransporter beta domain-containing protein n=1 Tax=Xenorhabdus koppenhoeferi TaxID=351659 RepID=UPI0019CB5385|nr:inverse autotransporter beta domain-containing protein [Xenorhabdus sp. Vera]MBD2812452.1 inverse autotransporter beta domain-containing protein [Xenorhabdus sp. Vera]